MASTNLLRLATRRAAPAFFRSSYTIQRAPIAACISSSTAAIAGFSTSAPAPAIAAASPAGGGAADPHHEESFEEFSARYEKEFEQVQDVFELQRNLNNAFAYDLVPSPSVITAALRAARRVNDFPTAVRIFEGIKAKVENKSQYEEYLDELKPLREELGVVLKEDLYPESA